MSSACTSSGSQFPQAQAVFNYEGRLSVSVAPNGAAGAAGDAKTAAADHRAHQMDYDQAVVLRRIKAECDMLTDYHSRQKEFGGADVMYSAPFSPPSSAFNQPAGGSQAAAAAAALPCTPQSGSNLRGQQQQVQDDSGISPGSTGTAPAANSGDESRKKRNANSESEDHAVGSGASASPFSDRFSGDGHLDDDDDELMDEPDEDDELLDEDASREAGSDVVGDALSRLERALNGQTAENASSANNSQTVYQCTMCSYSAASRFHFQAHLNSHFDVKCSHCDFTARTEGKLRAHVRNAHAEALGLDEGEVGGSKVPRVNSQGKLKTHKCKHPQCGFVAVTKLDFWEHSRTHIKAEKLLTCPHCPFVTEYKHHLEYHTRNHLNSKPFKCPKCSYSCVNKSMLNSHMKSHSNVYQFRCRDCAYATKYQHSLKLHLRKYGHTCTTTLSDANDGEVQNVKTKGRRGPKKTNKADKADKTAANPSAQAPSAPVTPPAGVFHPAPLPGVGSSPALGNPFGFPLYPGHPFLVNVASEPEKKRVRLNEESLKCTLCDYATTSREHFSQHLIAHAAADQQQLASLFGAFPADLLSASSNQTPLKGAGPIGLASSTPQMKDYLGRMLANPTLLFGTPPAAVVQQQLMTKNPAQVSRSPTPEPAAQSKPNQTPLDLSREKDDAPPVNGSNKQHRRKGQAFKLERSTPTIASPAGSPIHRRPSPAHSGTPSPSLIEPAAEEEEDDGLDTSLEKPIPRKEANKRQTPAEWGGAYQCAYCDIAFKDVVMYTMHMGYHGYQDPFTCNMCGQSTHDKLAFFLHIARSSHS